MATRIVDRQGWQCPQDQHERPKQEHDKWPSLSAVLRFAQLVGPDRCGDREGEANCPPMTRLIQALATIISSNESIGVSPE
jgi:hypothetical protein